MYAHANGAFIECVIKFDQPITFCSKCLQHFFNTTNSYDQLIKNESCRAKFMDNSMNLAVHLLDNSQEIWNNGYCSSKF